MTRKFGLFFLVFSLLSLSPHEVTVALRKCQDGRISKISVDSNAKVLNLFSKGVFEILPEIRYLAQLERLLLAYNDLEKLPEEIGLLTQLRGLDVGFNKLNRLPKSLVNLKNMRWISVIGNPLGFIPLYFQRLIPRSGFVAFTNSDDLHVIAWPDELTDLISKIVALRELVIDNEIRLPLKASMNVFGSGASVVSLNPVLWRARLESEFVKKFGCSLEGSLECFRASDRLKKLYGEREDHKFLMR
ncbi:leucine-rich repeat domain-containing protein [Candidatus Dependentiae bacterium]